MHHFFYVLQGITQKNIHANSIIQSNKWLKIIYTFLFLISATSISASTITDKEPFPKNKQGIPIANLLRPDGSINLEQDYNGNIDFSGFQMTYDENGAPIFLPESNSSICNSEDAWTTYGGICGMNNNILSMIIKGDTLYIAGWFETAFDQEANGIIQWANGQWRPLGQGVDGSIASLALKGDTLYAGGQFSMAAGQTVNNIAYWAGEQWHSMGTGVNSGVEALLVLDDILYVGGRFSEVNGQSISKIAQWKGSQWHAMNQGVAGSVYALAAKNDTLYVGGQYTMAGGQSANNIAAWAGDQWHSLGMGVNSRVQSLAVKGDTLYVGGSFTEAGGQTANRMAQWAGSQWHNMGDGVNNTVNDLIIKGDTLYAAGRFTQAGGQTTTGIAIWIGGQWQPYITNIEEQYPNVEALACFKDTLYVGGGFNTVDGKFLSKIFKYNNGTYSKACTAESITSGLNGDVTAIAKKGDTLYMGGRFTHAGDKLVKNIAQWVNGEWLTLGNGITSNDPRVNALLLKNDTLYMGGKFNEIDGQTTQNLAVWVNGQWQAFPSGTDGTIYTLFNKKDTLYIGGDFDQAGGQTNKNIVALANNQWHSLGTGVNGSVKALACIGDTLYIGGEFDEAGAITEGIEGIAQWSGGQWKAMNGGTQEYVYALATKGDTLYVGGYFEYVGPESSKINSSFIAQWAGGNWHPMQTGVNDQVNAIIVHDGNVYVGGEFDTISSQGISKLAKWSGGAWQDINSKIKFGYSTKVLALLTDTEHLFVGGKFNAVNNRISTNWASWKLPCNISATNIHVTHNSINLANSEADIGIHFINTPLKDTFYIHNTSNAPIQLSKAGMGSIISLKNNNQFTISQQPANSIPPNDSTFFEITYNNATIGSHNDSVFINPYNCCLLKETLSFSIKGQSIAQPIINIYGASVLEGNANEADKQINFTVNLNTAAILPVEVQFTSKDSTATISDNDYVSKMGTVTFDMGEHTKSISIDVKGDNKLEDNEVLLVCLNNPKNAILGAATTAKGFILESDVNQVNIETDQTNICDLTIRLNAGALMGNSTGEWKILSGQGACLSSTISTNPIFVGKANTSYQLEWITSNANVVIKRDTLNIAFSADSDNDGVLDCKDVCPGEDDKKDTDGDKAPDACDCNPNDATDSLATVVNNNPSQTAILSDTFQSSVKLIGTGNVEKDSSVVFKAGNNIQLIAGFHVKAGANFHAFIGPCTINALQEIESTVRNQEDKADQKVIPTYGLHIRPNPVKNKAIITLEVPKLSTVHLDLFNISGQKINQLIAPKSMPKGNYQWEMNTHSIPKGIYFLRMYSAEKVLTQKVIVQ